MCTYGFSKFIQLLNCCWKLELCTLSCMALESLASSETFRLSVYDPNSRDSYFGLAAVLPGTPLVLLGWLMNSPQASCVDLFHDLIRQPNISQLRLCIFSSYYPKAFLFDVLWKVGHISKSWVCQKENVTSISALALSVLTLDMDKIFGSFLKYFFRFYFIFIILYVLVLRV